MVEGSHKSYLLYIHTNFKRRFNGSELLDVSLICNQRFNLTNIQQQHKQLNILNISAYTTIASNRIRYIRNCLKGRG